MTKNIDTPIRDLSGVPLVEGGSPITVGSVAVNALLTASEGNPSGPDKASRYRLAVRLARGGEADLSPEELTLLKSLVGSAYLPLVVGQVFEWADA